MPTQEQEEDGYIAPTISPEGGGWSAPSFGRFNSGTDPVPIVQEAG
jgi:hypothetical protein